MRSVRGMAKNLWVVRAAGLAFGGVLVGLVFLVATLAWVARDLPSPDRVVRREGFSTKIYDRNGELLYDVYSDQRRTPVDLAQTTLVLRQATISIEDKTSVVCAKSTGVLL